MGISSPLAKFGDPPVGVGWNMHATVPGTSGSASTLGRGGWLRIDDQGGARSGSISALKTLHSTAKGMQFNVVQTIDIATQGLSAVGGHARDVVLQCPLIDWLELGNEPDLHGFGNSSSGPTSYMQYVKAVYNATRVGCNVRLCGPSLSNISGSQVTWYQNVVAAGLLDYVQAVTLHPYTFGNFGPTSDPEKIIDFVTTLRGIVGNSIPIILTEFGYQTAWAERAVGGANGSWTAAGAAALIYRAIQAAQSVGVPLCIYDGVGSLNDSGYGISSTVTIGHASSTTVTAPTAGMFQGMSLQFPNSGSPVLRTITNIFGGSSFQVNSAVTTQIGDVITDKDNNQDVADDSGIMTTFGTDLVALLPAGGVANA